MLDGDLDNKNPGGFRPVSGIKVGKSSDGNVYIILHQGLSLNQCIFI